MMHHKDAFSQVSLQRCVETWLEVEVSQLSSATPIVRFRIRVLQIRLN